jgi:hypothetical protein
MSKQPLVHGILPALCLVLLLGSCSTPIDKKGEDLVREIEAKNGQITEAEWKTYDERLVALEKEFDEKSGALPDSVRQSFNEQIGKYKMLRLMGEMEGFGKDVKDALDQIKGAMDLVKDSLKQEIDASGSESK